jgi:FHA domain
MLKQSAQPDGSARLDTAVIAAPALVCTLAVLEPEPLRGHTFALDRPKLTIGRSEESDVRLDDAYVSRDHAVITRQHRALFIEDVGSRAGVSVNGLPVHGPVPIRDGDLVQLGRVLLEVRGTARGHAGQNSTPDIGQRRGSKRRFAVDGQYAGTISNVAGNQYNEHALRIAPMRRRARNVMRVGFLLTFAGSAVGAIGMARFATPILDCLRHPGARECTSGVDTTGWTITAAGSVILGLGVLTIIASLFMKRAATRKERQL